MPGVGTFASSTDTAGFLRRVGVNGTTLAEYTMNPAARQARITRDGVTESFTFTPTGQVAEYTVLPGGVTSPAVLVTMTYDAAGRLASVSSPGEFDETVTYGTLPETMESKTTLLGEFGSLNGPVELAQVVRHDATGVSSGVFDTAGRPLLVTDASGTRQQAWYRAGALQASCVTRGTVAAWTVVDENRVRIFEAAAASADGMVDPTSGSRADLARWNETVYTFDASRRVQEYPLARWAGVEYKYKR